MIVEHSHMPKYVSSSASTYTGRTDNTRQTWASMKLVQMAIHHGPDHWQATHWIDLRETRDWNEANHTSELISPGQ